MEATPSRTRSFWAKWRAFGAKIGHFNGLVLLTVLYWSLICIVSVFFALLRQDPLGRRRRLVSAYAPKHLRTEKREYQHIY